MLAEKTDDSQYGSNAQLVQQERRAARDLPLCSRELRLPWVEFAIGAVSILLSLCLMVGGSATSSVQYEKRHSRNFTAVYFGIFFLIVGVVSLVTFGFHFSRVRQAQKKAYINADMGVANQNARNMENTQNLPVNIPMTTRGPSTEGTNRGVYQIPSQSSTPQDSAYSSFAVYSSSGATDGHSELDARNLPSNSRHFNAHLGYATERPTMFNNQSGVPQAQPRYSMMNEYYSNTQPSRFSQATPQTSASIHDRYYPSKANARGPNLASSTVRVEHHSRSHNLPDGINRPSTSRSPYASEDSSYMNRRPIMGNPSVVADPHSITIEDRPLPRRQMPGYTNSSTSRQQLHNDPSGSSVII